MIYHTAPNAICTHGPNTNFQPNANDSCLKDSCVNLNQLGRKIINCMAFIRKYQKISVCNYKKCTDIKNIMLLLEVISFLF